jgi:hypothetical protein
MPQLAREKITLGEMRAAGVSGLPIYCSDYHCSHSTTISADRWPDDVGPSDIEMRFICEACGRRGADVRPDWQSAEAYACQGLVPRLRRANPACSDDGV